MKLKHLLRLKNTVQNYSWGSHHVLGELFGIANPGNEPQAEIWMGAHPKAPSLVEVKEGHYVPLDELIRQHPEKILGASVTRQFGGRLPYLFKVLSAAEPLSIQAHPDKLQAEQGFKRENEAGISLSASFRNYKDDNHKPELIYALTPFRAMNGFRPLDQIIELFRLLGNSFIDEQLDALLKAPEKGCLKIFYAALMQVDSVQRKIIIQAAQTAAVANDHPAFLLLLNLFEQYPDDIGVLSPLLLNIVDLKPGEAMFLDAGTLHAYLEGTGLEVMASSDNVLRGGLTPKHVDVSELLSTVRFTSLEFDNIKVVPVKQGDIISYPVPVNDFSFSVLTIKCQEYSGNARTAELLFCGKGEVLIKKASDSLILKPGEACLIPADTRYTIDGHGKVILVGCLAS